MMASLCVFQNSEAKAEPEKNQSQSRYNLRRRKDDKAADPAPQEQEEEVKQAVAPPTVGSTPLDFGGRIGRLGSGF